MLTGCGLRCVCVNEPREVCAGALLVLLLLDWCEPQPEGPITARWCTASATALVECTDDTNQSPVTRHHADAPSRPTHHGHGGQRALRSTLSIHAMNAHGLHYTL